MIDWVTFTFSSRELAFGLWLFIFACCLFLFYKDIRHSFSSLISSIFLPKILGIFFLLAINILFICCGLKQLGLWQMDQIKSSIFWYFLTGVGLLFRVTQAKENDKFFKKAIADNLKVIVIFEFIIVAYSFSFITEFIVFPFIVILSLSLGISKTHKELVSVKYLIESLLFVYAMFIAWNSISIIYKEPQLFWNTTTARDFMLPIFLSVGCLPCLYLVFIWIHIEQFNLRMNLKDYHTDHIRKYGKWKFCLAFWLRPYLLYRAARQFNCLSVKNRKDVRNIIREIKTYERLKNNPPKVKMEDGWSPYLAIKFYLTLG